ncbi:immunoglobulin-like domain-containing protein, partial [Aeromonas media]|uniref:immunoglobulin-like domain-containing protein n=1 Tax=Aeromonas media TaxID=651 RepID=UPI0013A69652
SQASQGDTTIVTTLGNIVIGDGQTVGTLVIATQDSDVYLDADSLSATITGASGGNFESLVIGTASATAQIADTIDEVTVNLSTSDVDEDDASVTFTATLSQASQGDTTIVTTLGNIVIGDGQTVGTLVIATQDSDV